MATSRQDLRRFVLAPETTIGTYLATNGVILPVAPGYSFNIANDRVTLDGVADGYAGGVASVRTKRRWEGELAVYMYDGDTNPFPAWMLVLLASGWQATYSGGVFTLTPSTKPLTNWPGFTAGDRSPCAVSMTEVLLDNATNDRRGQAASCTFATKIKVMRNEPITFTAALLGLIPSGSDGYSYTDTDASDVGALSATQGTQPVVCAPSSISATWKDDTGSISGAALLGCEGFELDLAPTHELIAGGANGYAPASVVYAASGTLTLTVEASRTDDFELPDRTYLDLSVTETLASGAKWVIDLPHIEILDRKFSNNAGKLVAEYTCAVNRSGFGDSTSPVTITYTPAT